MSSAMEAHSHSINSYVFAPRKTNPDSHRCRTNTESEQSHQTGFPDLECFLSSPDTPTHPSYIWVQHTMIPDLIPFPATSMLPPTNVSTATPPPSKHSSSCSPYSPSGSPASISPLTPDTLLFDGLSCHNPILTSLPQLPLDQTPALWLWPSSRVPMSQVRTIGGGTLPWGSQFSGEQAPLPSPHLGPSSLGTDTMVLPPAEPYFGQQQAQQEFLQPKDQPQTTTTSVPFGNPLASSHHYLSPSTTVTSSAANPMAMYDPLLFREATPSISLLTGSTPSPGPSSLPNAPPMNQQLSQRSLRLSTSHLTFHTPSNWSGQSRTPSLTSTPVETTRESAPGSTLLESIDYFQGFQNITNDMASKSSTTTPTLGQPPSSIASSSHNFSSTVKSLPLDSNQLYVWNHTDTPTGSTIHFDMSTPLSSTQPQDFSAIGIAPPPASNGHQLSRLESSDNSSAYSHDTELHGRSTATSAFRPRYPPTSVNKGERDRHLRDSVRTDPLYHEPPNTDGFYVCPWSTQCRHQATKLKCDYEKYLDSHIRPYRCQMLECANLFFSSTACLLRHERETHRLHGHQNVYCPYSDCERSQEGKGFPRVWNLSDHMKRVHNDHTQSSVTQKTSPSSASRPVVATSNSEKQQQQQQQALLKKLLPRKLRLKSMKSTKKQQQQSHQSLANGVLKSGVSKRRRVLGTSLNLF